MERLGINAQAQQARKGVWESTAGSVPNPGPENSQFSFPIFQEGAALATPTQPVFATAQWPPKEPPAFTRNANDDV